MNEALDNPLAWRLEDGDRSAIEQKNKEISDLNALFLKTFSTQAGAEVLKYLRENTIEAGTWMASLPYEKAIAHGFAREGQNALVRMIEQRIEQAKGANK